MAMWGFVVSMNFSVWGVLVDLMALCISVDYMVKIVKCIV